MDILLLRGFNNYFNRVVKKYSTLADYRAHSASYIDLSGVNFNPNDGVATELVLGGPNQLENNAVFAWDVNGTPDYLITYESNTIKSRWFVLESERTRAGQYKVALKRDIIAEEFDKVMTAPCFVEKGVVSSIQNPLLYNNEAMSYNQIKKQEIALKDSTNSGWIVGYLAKNRSNTTHSVSTTLAITDGIPANYIDAEDLPFSVNPNGNTVVYNYIQDTLSTAIAAAHVENGRWGYYYTEQGYKINNFNNNALKVAESNGAASSFLVYNAISDEAADLPTTPSGVYNYLVNNGFADFKASSQIPFYDSNGNAVFMVAPVKDETSVNLISNYFYYTWDQADPGYPAAIQNKATLYNAVTPTVDASLKSTLNSLMGSYAAVTSTNIRTLYNDKYVKIGNEYYRMSISETGKSKYDLFTSVTAPSGRPSVEGYNGNLAEIHANATIGNKLSTIIQSQSGTYATAANTESRSGSFVIAKSVGYNVVLSRISTETVETTMSANRRSTYDCVADIFAIPYGEVKYKLTDAGDTYTTNRDEGLAIARAIAQELGDTVCYDLQLVPYVPSAIVREIMEDSDTLCLDDLEAANYDVVTRTFTGVTSNATFILYVSSAKGTFDIPVTLNPKDFGYGAVMNAKLSNETEKCRLVSPNFSSMFEFSLAKNHGITKINVDYTYKPYMPYIHMNPDFKGLYGQDWDDVRGLILGGDFSLAFLNSAWANYQNNNKNYQAIFNRQIENMDVNNRMALEQQDFKNMGSVLTMVANAASPINTIAAFAKTAITNPLVTEMGAVKETDWLRRAQVESKDYAKDMYGYELGNIQAQPYALARSESLTNNHKIFPLIEVYECTDEEAVNLFNKLKYNGMTVMAIGKLSDYIRSADIDKVYVKGQLIRIESLNDDFHVADALYTEVNKGFFVNAEEEE